MANNVINAVFSSSTITYTKPAYQYDYGMILKLSGIELPQAYEVHFSNTEFCGESISQIGDESGVTIPDEMFLSGNPIYAWTFLHTGEDDGETVYKTVISINKRAQPSDIEPTPVQQDVITQAIAALNVAVEQTAQDVVDATAAKDAAELAQGKAEDAQTAAETAQGKAEDAQSSAEVFAGDASQSASDAQGYASDAQGYAQDAEQAAGSVLGLTADASVDASVGTPSVEVNVTTVSDHKNMAFSFHNLKGVPGDPGEPGDDGFSPVVSVSAITGGHEVAVTDAQGTQTFDVMDGEVSEEQLETALIDKADVITSSASGEIVTIADGGNDMPVVDLKLSLLPVQSGSGDPSPDNVRPISGWTGVKINKDDSIVFPPDTAIGQGTIDGSTGAASSSNTRIRCSYFPIEPNTKYTAYSNLPYIGARFYTTNESSGIISADNINLTEGSITFTTGSTTQYARFIFAKALPSTGSGSVRVTPSELEYVNVISERGEIIPIDWTDEAGTVYGCNFSLTSGVLTVTDAQIVSYAGETLPSTWISDRDVYAPGTTPTTGAQVVYKLSTPLTFQLSENQIATFLGINNFWSNGNGVVDLEYRADTKLYIEQLTKPTEDDMTANANIASGKFFMVGSNALYLSTVAIAQGEKIIEGTNCTRISLADALNQINA